MKEKILAVIADSIKVDKRMLSENLSIGDIPEWDSMGNLCIIRNIEEAFDIDIPMDDLFELTSVKSIIAEVNKLKQK